MWDSLKKLSRRGLSLLLFGKVANVEILKVKSLLPSLEREDDGTVMGIAFPVILARGKNWSHGTSVPIWDWKAIRSV